MQSHITSQSRSATRSLKSWAARTLLGTAVLGAASAASAATLTVTVTNLTRATWFTPLLVAAHPASFVPFTVGQPASVEIQTIAETGGIAPMQALLPGGSAVVANPNNGPLRPGGSVTTQAFSGGAGTSNGKLTILSMLVPTNDGFMALDAIDIPTAPGTYTYMVNAYDAGTEGNDEKRAAAGGINQPGLIFPGFLNDSSGNLAPSIRPNAPGFNAQAEGFVHIHRGVVGSGASGPSALDSTVYRWLNPVARVVLTVQ